MVEALPSLGEEHTLVNTVRRFPELDALRGLATLSVFASHSVLFVYRPYAADPSVTADTLGSLIAHSPLCVFWAGHEAVILFFMLSGFVLSLPWLKGTQAPYPQFVFRRFCRIWIPFIGRWRSQFPYAGFWTAIRRHKWPCHFTPPGE